MENKQRNIYDKFDVGVVGSNVLV